MQNNHYPLYKDPNLALPPPPRFDAAATAAARRVEPLSRRRFAWVYDNIQLAPSHWKLLVLTAIVSLTTGGVGGMLIKDGQPTLSNESTLNSVTGESQSITPEGYESTSGITETSPANISLSPVAQPQRSNTRLRRASRLHVVELEDEESEDEDEEDRKRKKDDDDDRDRNPDDRKRRVADDDDRKDDDDDHHRRQDRKRDEDDERVQRPRRAAMMYDIMRIRRP